MDPIALVPGGREDLFDRLPEAERAVADREVRRNLKPTLANLLGDLPHAVHLLLVTDLMGFLGSLPSACLLPATILAT